MNYKTNLADSEPPVQQSYHKSANVKRRAELEYLSDMIPQMRKMALALEEERLAYLLELAMMEAQLQYEIEKFSGELE